MDDRRGLTDRRALHRLGGRRLTDDPADWVCAAEYARRYGVSRNTVQKWLDAKLLRVYQMETIVRIRNVPPDEHKRLLREFRERQDCSPVLMDAHGVKHAAHDAPK